MLEFAFSGNLKKKSDFSKGKTVATTPLKNTRRGHVTPARRRVSSQWEFRCITKWFTTRNPFGTAKFRLAKVARTTQIQSASCICMQPYPSITLVGPRSPPPLSSFAHSKGFVSKMLNATDCTVTPKGGNLPGRGTPLGRRRVLYCDFGSQFWVRTKGYSAQCWTTVITAPKQQRVVNSCGSI